MTIEAAERIKCDLKSIAHPTVHTVPGIQQVIHYNAAGSHYGDTANTRIQAQNKLQLCVIAVVVIIWLQHVSIWRPLSLLGEK